MQSGAQHRPTRAATVPAADRLPQVPAPSVPYLYQVVSLLWPGSTVARYSTWDGRRAGRRDLQNGQTEFLALPDAERPALLVPTAPKLVTATALREAKTGGPTGRRRLLALAGAAAGLGITPLLPSRTVVVTHADGGPAPLVDWLSMRLGVRLHAALAAGPARANRKPIVHLIDEFGTTIAFAKVGTNDLTRRLVLTEAAALKALSHTALPGIRVPSVLLHDQWQGHEVLVQEPLQPRGNQAVVGAKLVERMSVLAHSVGVTTGAVSDSAYVADLRARLGSVADEHPRAELTDALDRLVSRHGEQVLELGTWHGDWTPWNMASAGLQVLLWDWERYGSGVPLGFDALHHHLQGRVVREGVPVARVADELPAAAGALLVPFDVTPAQAQVTALLYLLELGTRYSVDGQRAAGGALSQLDEWLLPALARHVGAPARREC